MSKQQAQVACAVTHMHFPSHVMVVNANPDASPMAADAPSKTCVDFVCSCIAYSAFAVTCPMCRTPAHEFQELQELDDEVLSEASF